MLIEVFLSRKCDDTGLSASLAEVIDSILTISRIIKISTVVFKV